ncbi:uncharacterized protein [Typha angustifolia]|uniref:uncharacterized protein isoform X3 n=1 Tax=Typha angustifolia TaxID=59011 RepID=UPI003C2B4E23
MSMCNPLYELSERLGYVQCSFCTTILLVSVPCSSLLNMVTVRCGHCTGLLSVSLARTSFLPLQVLTSLEDDQQELCGDTAPKACNDSSDEEAMEEESTPKNPVVNKRKRYRGSKLENPTLPIKRPSAQLLKIGHISLGFTIRETARAAVVDMGEREAMDMWMRRYYLFKYDT